MAGLVPTARSCSAAGRSQGSSCPPSCGLWRAFLSATLKTILSCHCRVTFMNYSPYLLLGVGIIGIDIGLAIVVSAVIWAYRPDFSLIPRPVCYVPARLACSCDTWLQVLPVVRSIKLTCGYGSCLENLPGSGRWMGRWTVWPDSQLGLDFK